VRVETRSDAPLRLLSSLAAGSSAVTEFRDSSGRLVWRDVSVGDKSDPGTACGDSRHVLAGARWGTFPAYFVNVSAVPDGFDAGEALSDWSASGTSAGRRVTRPRRLEVRVNSP
jgi:hypothetical protein